MKKVTLKEWNLILKQSPSNDDLRYIIEYTDKKNEAKLLLTEEKKMIEIIKNRQN